MSDTAVIAFAIIYAVTVAGFLFLLFRITRDNAKQQDLLLERIQRPEMRPFNADEFPEPTIEGRDDLGELAAIGMIDPSLNRPVDAG